MKTMRCPKCRRDSLYFTVYMHFRAPAKFYRNLSKTNRRHRDVNCVAALWETTEIYCMRCRYVCPPTYRVRLKKNI